MKLILLTFVLLFASVPSLRVKNDREINQLKGTVKTYKSEWVTFSEGKESQRKLWQQMTFDLNGNYLQYTIFNNDNPSTYNFTNKYDRAGNVSETIRSGSGEKIVFVYAPDDGRIEKITQTNDGHALDKWVYTFDASGNKTREEHILIDKALGERFIKPIDLIVFRYNSQSLLIEEEYFNHDGSNATNRIEPIHKKALVYDSQKRLTESTAYKTDGTIFNRSVMRYDDRGNLSDKTIYNADGVVTGKNTYSDYDSHGNWGRQIISTVPPNGGKALTLTRAVYQTFTYY